MVEQKTRPHTGDVEDFIAQVDDPIKRADSQVLIEMMEDISGEPPVLWGTMVGFGQYHYKYASGHEGNAFRIGFAPRKGDISLYVLGASDEQAALLAKLGKHRAGKSCLYVKRLADIDMDVLRELTAEAVRFMDTTYPR